MDSDDPLPFRIECPRCDVVKETSDYSEANKFAQKHQRHTGHEMNWVRVNFDKHLIAETQWEVSCEICEKVWNFDSQEGAQEHREEHATYTDHEIADRPKQVTVDKFDFDSRRQSVKELISELEEEYREGAPTKAVLAIMTQSGKEMDDVQSTIEKLRTKGEIYEPQSGYLRAT